ncbi:TetR/AcrR family transcriptional regulator [Bacillus gaemokensis]|uniref:TetR family transcriptional regulator n=1 Tax=Bacillus gaemokensis TaxID=574375 RepID=A0A073K8X1_9BACI|nr:TetR/AcrR family transcriptional regulator [Bacillus gaemokensis]KEK22995.1 TetR family transcriptional regulator [Bacillus gaemokensis]KYG37451.1 TetR family transcriptional regulator [Bacillus gaemokensis]
MNRRRLTQEERKQETRQLLLASAFETFAKFGFHGASVDKIAEHAGFSKGAIYAHFHTKEDLFLAIVEQQMNLYVQDLRQVIEQQQSLANFIETMDVYSHSVRQKTKTWSMLSMEFLLYAMREESVRHKWSNMITDTVEQISNSIEILLLKENYKSTLSAKEIAWTMLSLENGMSIFYNMNEQHLPLDLYKKALQNMLLSFNQEE